ncbi:hypothetical protein GCM10009616_05590 [Microlunatus lacustris]
MTTPRAGRLDAGQRSQASAPVQLDTIGELIIEQNVAVTSLLQLPALLEDQIRTIPGVRGCESSVYLKLSKQTYPWGTR